MQSSSPATTPLLVSSTPLEDSAMEDSPVSRVMSSNLVTDPVMLPGFENFPPPPRFTAFSANWSSLFDKQKEAVVNTDTEFFSYPVVDRKKNMDIPYVVFDQDIRDCESKVIGAFVGRRLPFNMVHNAVNRAWKPKGTFQMTIHGERMFIFDFNSEEERIRALEIGSMFISNRLFIVKPRTVEQEIAELKSVLVWMNFRNVPLFMWNNKGLSMIASYLGKPLMMDTQTLNKTRMSYARICVEVGVNCEFSESFTFTLGGKDRVEINMDYSWRPPKCSDCAVFGYVLSHCPKKVHPTHKVVQKWGQKPTTTSRNEDGWITKSRNQVKDTSMQVTTVLQEIPASTPNKVNDLIFSNSFFIIDNYMENPQVLQSNHNKENFQALLQAAQQKSSEQVSGSRVHFQKEGPVPQQVSSILPKVAALKKAAKNNDSRSCYGRIWVGWDPGVIHVNLIHSSPQAVFLDITTPSSINLAVTLVYGDNYYLTRNALWNSLISFAVTVNKALMVLGNFNSILYPSDKVGGAPVLPHHFQDFSTCVHYTQLMDLSFMGYFYTWTNCQQDGSVIRSKIDRVMANLQMHDPPPFRFFNFLSDEPEYMNVVRTAWNIPVRGNPMITLVTRVKNVKSHIINWKRFKFRNVSAQVLQAKENMDFDQLQLQSFPLDLDLARRETEYVAEYVKLVKYEESAAKQQARLVEDKDIAVECIDYYKNLFGNDLVPEVISDSSTNLHFDGCIQQDDIADLIKHVSREEVVTALNSIGSNKAPGPDENEVMINTDGSKREHTAGFGDVLRDHMAEMLDAAYGGSHPISILVHEL
ncbi:uncharacterized protein LOC113352177 [Papaver somniferum]|uniref:uncharacterized protein LOC113352177 n=1 Tax=Papaver somniferum TaxID=3469 RepID=UPI000E702097|nr:uncharacterized protein LOC113352177 [Papaver somniferum]